MKRNKRPKNGKRLKRRKKPVEPVELVELVELKQSEIANFREVQWKRQNLKCGILKQKISKTDTTLDHKHKRKNEKPGPNGRGLIRGVLHFQANSLEGVITNKFKRFGLNKFITLSEFLRNMADYIDTPPCSQKYIHPTEVQNIILKKSEYNIITKYYLLIFPRRKVVPEYPKRGVKKTKAGVLIYKAKKTKKWAELLNLATDYRDNKTHKKKRNK